MDTSDFAKRLADKLIAQLKEGTAPWQKPWVEGQFFGPYNPTTGNRYRGINVLALLSTDFSDPRWMTYRQAQAQGWQVRGGERSTQIQHWIWEEERVRVGKDGQPVLDNQRKLIKDLVRLEQPKVITAAVFNAEQIDGIPALEPERTYDWDPVEQAEKLLQTSEAKIEHSQTGGAYYRLSTDTIRLPTPDRFETPSAYYATALHELGHWTGHPDRLDRDLSNPFGSEGYAREELRAEIGSLILGSELGIGHDPVAHAGYVDHWVQILTDTPKEILYAAADAERISDYILTIEQKKELRQNLEIEGLRRETEVTWSATNKSPSVQEIARYVEQVHAAKGKFVIADGSYISVERAMENKRQYEVNIRSGDFSRAGYSAASYVGEIGGFNESAVALVPRISEATKGNEKLKDRFMEGFRSSVNGSYDEDEERYPSSKESIEKQKRREEFIAKVGQRLDRENKEELTRLQRENRPFEEHIDRLNRAGEKTWFLNEQSVSAERIGRFLEQVSEWGGETLIVDGKMFSVEQRENTQEAQVQKEQIPHAERKYLAVPYEERDQAKAVGARWDPVKKAWYVGPEADREKIAKWEPKHQPAPTLDPRAEFAAVLREIGAVVQGEHPIMNGKPQRIPATNDKPGERTIFYVAHSDGVASGYAENNRTKEVVRWKARGQHLSQEAKAELLAQAAQKRYARRQAEQEMYEATAKRLSEDLRGLSSGVETTAYHSAKQIEAMPGAPVRNGDMLVPGYDAEGKLWTVQYIKEDGTKRFAKESRKYGCFHVVGAANAAAGLQKIGLSPVVVIAEGYATAASIAKHAKVPAIAAFDSGNLLAVATAIRERYKDKQIIIAGDDDHGRENNPGRTKALEAAAAVKGLAVFPQLSTEQREQGFTDFNDLARQDPELLIRQFEDVIRRGREQSPAQGIELGPTSRAEAERQLYRTTTVGQLVAALVESRDQTDIRHVFEHHEGGTQGFEIACQSLGISKVDWNHANNVAGFHALVAIIGNKLGLPRHDPAAEQARREEVAAIIKSPVRAATQSVELARAI